MIFVTGVVGLDLSLTSSGVARVGEDGVPTDRFAVGSKASDGLTVGDRYKKILSAILQITRPEDLVVVEDYAYNINAKKSSLAQLAELGGLVKFSVWRRTARWPVTVASTTLKKWLTGKGNAQKDDLKLLAFKKYDIAFKTSDEMMAFGLAEIGHRLVFPEVGRVLFKYEKECLKTVLASGQQAVQALAK